MCENPKKMQNGQHRGKKLNAGREKRKRQEEKGEKLGKKHF